MAEAKQNKFARNLGGLKIQYGGRVFFCGMRAVDMILFRAQINHKKGARSDNMTQQDQRPLYFQHGGACFFCGIPGSTCFSCTNHKKGVASGIVLCDTRPTDGSNTRWQRQNKCARTLSGCVPRYHPLARTTTGHATAGRKDHKPKQDTGKFMIQRIPLLLFNATHPKKRDQRPSVHSNQRYKTTPLIRPGGNNAAQEERKNCL